MARVTVELGLIGLALIYFLRVLIAAFALRYMMKFEDRAYRSLGIVLAIYLSLGVITSVILSVTVGLYYWGSFGLLLTMRRLQQVGPAPVRRAGQTDLQSAVSRTRQPVGAPSNSIN
jgi:hypothetical protein